MNQGRVALEKPVETPVPPGKRLYIMLSSWPSCRKPINPANFGMENSSCRQHPLLIIRKSCFGFIAGSTNGSQNARWARVIAAPIDMVLSPHRVTQPDVAFIAQDRLNIIGRVINGAVDLAVEVISLGNRNRDRIEKRDLYEQYGVKEYWIIDPEAQTVEVLFLESGRYRLLMRCTAIKSRLPASCRR